MIRPVRGCRDLLYEESCLFNHIVESANKVGCLYGFQEIKTPILEYSDVFLRSLGQYSDIVHKEMYSFLDKSGDSLTLRPEFTAGVMRAVISNKLQGPLRLFSYGPLFRYDRPQAGRARQFHQINFEMLGLSSPFFDAEIIKLGRDILDSLEIEDVTLELNSLGCQESRKNYEKALHEYFYDNKESLSDISRIRLDKNPLRILDSKEEQDKKISENAPFIKDFYSDLSKQQAEQVLIFLDKFNIKYKLNYRLVRGLDYYSFTTFEFVQNAFGFTLIAGGRYDELGKIMGEVDIPSIGFAGGIERIMMSMNKKLNKKTLAVIIPISEDENDFSMTTLNSLRNDNVACVIELVGKIGNRVQKAVKYGAQYAIFIGSDEILQNHYKVKNLDTGEEQLYNYETLVKKLKYDRS